MNKQVQQIANRHVARCLSKIDGVHELPEICADNIRREMHYLAKDVVTAISKQGGSDAKDDDTRFNR